MRRSWRHLLGVLLILAACDDPMKMFPDYQVGGPRILALKVSEPELTPDAAPTMRLLVGGEQFEQSSDAPVLWLLPNDEAVLGQVPPEIRSQLTVPYHTAFSFPAGMTVGTLLSLDPEIQKAFDETGFVDLPLFATITVNDKPLSIMKRVRITREPRHRNPEITKITAVWQEPDGTIISHTVPRDGTLELPQDPLPDYLALAPETIDPAERGNDLLVFRWHFNEDAAYATRLRFCDADCPSEKYLGVERVTPNTKEIMIDFTVARKRFADTPPDGDLSLMFYLVVRDRAAESASSADDHFGLDFTTMKVVLKRP